MGSLLPAETPDTKPQTENPTGSLTPDSTEEEGDGWTLRSRGRRKDRGPLRTAAPPRTTGLVSPPSIVHPVDRFSGEFGPCGRFFSRAHARSLSRRGVYSPGLQEGPPTTSGSSLGSPDTVRTHKSRTKYRPYLVVT